MEDEPKTEKPIITQEVLAAVKKKRHDKLSGRLSRSTLTRFVRKRRNNKLRKKRVREQIAAGTYTKKTKPTEKQKKAFALVAAGMKQEKALRMAGYAQGTARSSTDIIETKGWQTLVKQYLDEEDLMKVHKEGLAATKVIELSAKRKKYVRDSKEYAEDPVQDLFIEVPDHGTRHKFLETAYKIQGRLTQNVDITSGGEKLHYEKLDDAELDKLIADKLKETGTA